MTSLSELELCKFIGTWLADHEDFFAKGGKIVLSFIITAE